MNKKTLLIILLVLITLDIIRDGYLKGFMKTFRKNMIKYKKTALVGVVITIFSVFYLDLPVAREFSNKYFYKTLQRINKNSESISSNNIKKLKEEVKLEEVNKNKYKKIEHFLSTQGKGVITGATVCIFLFLGFLFRNKKLIKTSKEAIMSLLMAGILVNLVKIFISRLRPDVNMIPYQFFNWTSWFSGKGSINPFSSSCASFPSGHAIVVVAVASSFYLGYKNKLIRALALIYAIVLSGARIYGTRHWLSDVISATFLAILVSKTIYDINNKNLGNIKSVKSRIIKK